MANTFLLQKSSGAANIIVSAYNDWVAQGLWGKTFRDEAALGIMKGEGFLSSTGAFISNGRYWAFKQVLVWELGYLPIFVWPLYGSTIVNRVGGSENPY